MAKQEELAIREEFIEKSKGEWHQSPFNARLIRTRLDQMRLDVSVENFFIALYQLQAEGLIPESERKELQNMPIKQLRQLAIPVRTPAR